jgi:hypothetical protein
MEQRVAELAELAARLKDAARDANREAHKADFEARGRRIEGAVRGSDARFEAKAVSYWRRTHISPTVGGADWT